MNTETTAIDGTATKTVKEVSLMTSRDVTLSSVKSGRIYTDNWQDCKISLSDTDIEQIADLLGGWARTKEAVKLALRNIHSLRSKWYFDRILFSKYRNEWVYCAGQDYSSEIAEIRKDLANY